jgi:hypothetical protein
MLAGTERAPQESPATSNVEKGTPEMRITKKKAAAVIVVASVAMAGAGGAYAYWTTGGEGTGSASAGSNIDFTIAQDNEVTDLVLDLGQTVEFTVTNPAAFAQYLTAVDVEVDAFTAQADADKPPCTEDDFAISDITIAAGDISANGSRNGTAVITLENSETNQDNCKGAGVALSFTAS